MNSTGWIYVVGCPLYDAQGLRKIGYTAQATTLEDEVKRKLIQRYETTLPEAVVAYLVRVAHPRTAEQHLFRRLGDCRYSKELFRVDAGRLERELLFLRSEYSITAPFLLRDDVLARLVGRLRGKVKKLARDTKLVNSVQDWARESARCLGVDNSMKVTHGFNHITMPNMYSSICHWSKLKENSHVLPMRINDFKQLLSGNWDRRDLGLGAFLKVLLIRC